MKIHDMLTVPFPFQNCKFMYECDKVRCEFVPSFFAQMFNVHFISFDSVNYTHNIPRRTNANVIALKHFSPI